MSVPEQAANTANTAVAKADAVDKATKRIVFEVVLNDQGQPLGLQISNLAPFGPADRANMLPGQVIVGVNRRNTVTFKQFCRNMPAEPGTRVRLSVFDPGSGKVVAISLRPGTRR